MLKLIAPVFFRLGLMLLTLTAVQLTYIYYDENTFILLNAIYFLIGLHTALTYSAQVKIWEKGQIQRRDILRALFLSGLVSIALLFFSNLYYVYFLSCFLYLNYRFLDRIIFNIFITQKRIYLAYGVAICVIAVEIAAFMLTLSAFDKEVARFVIPSCVCAALAVAIYLLSSLRTLPNPGAREEESTIRNGMAFSLHSLFILLTIMSDRVIASIPSDKEFLGSYYLLLFTYGGAAYSLGVAMLEPLRPSFYKVAKEVSSLWEFIKHTQGPWIITVCLLPCFIASFVAITISMYFNFGNPNSFGPLAQTIFTLSGLAVFFGLFLLLSYFQIYFLSRRLFIPIFASWCLALSVKGGAVWATQLDVYLIVSCLSGVAAVSSLLMLGAHQRFRFKKHVIFR